MQILPCKKNFDNPFIIIANNLYFNKIKLKTRQGEFQRPFAGKSKLPDLLVGKRIRFFFKHRKLRVFYFSFSAKEKTGNHKADP